MQIPARRCAFFSNLGVDSSYHEYYHSPIRYVLPPPEPASHATHVEVVSVYRPAWRNRAGLAVRGRDEDSITMAVQAAAPLIERALAAGLHRLVVVTRQPALLAGPTEAVIGTALGLEGDVAVEVHLGGGPAALGVLAGAAPGTLVVGVDPDPPAAAAAAFVSSSGGRLQLTHRVDGRLAARVRAAGGPAVVLDDARLLRDAGWRTAMGNVSDHGPIASVVGAPAAIAADYGVPTHLTDAIAATGAAAPICALAELAQRTTNGALVAVEADTMTAAAVAAANGIRVVRDEPPPVDGPGGHDLAQSAPIPASAAAQARAFTAKVRFAGGRCECGALDLPPRSLCLGCGRSDASRLEALPRTGTVYSTVTVHAPVPGKSTPYSLAIIELDTVGVRHLAPVTDVPAGSVAIGHHGRLLLRRIAERQTGPDYGWAFAPEPLVAAS